MRKRGTLGRQDVEITEGTEPDEDLRVSAVRRLTEEWGTGSEGWGEDVIGSGCAVRCADVRTILLRAVYAFIDAVGKAKVLVLVQAALRLPQLFFEALFLFLSFSLSHTRAPLRRAH